jgi:uncharacterized Zn finger protein|tara:strand:+ start:174 stop:413 length:240 start_codon:yes stop_codon:yes gene_type:complete
MAYKASGPRYFKPDEITFADHWAIDTEWEVAGSKDNVYTVKFTPKGFTCDCTGMSFRGKCKHTVSISNGFTQHDEDTAT